MCSRRRIPSSPVNSSARLTRALNGVDLQGVALARQGMGAVVAREDEAFRHRRVLGRHRPVFPRLRFDLVRRLHA